MLAMKNHPILWAIQNVMQWNKVCSESGKFYCHLHWEKFGGCSWNINICLIFMERYYMAVERVCTWARDESLYIYFCCYVTEVQWNLLCILAQSMKASYTYNNSLGPYLLGSLWYSNVGCYSQYTACLCVRQKIHVYLTISLLKLC